MIFVSKLKAGRAKLQEDRGSILIENAFMLPLLLFMGLGATELSMAFMDKNDTNQLAISYAAAISKKGGLVTEKELNELFNKSGQNANLSDFATRGRVIATAFKGRPGGLAPLKLWQRCSPQPAGKTFGTQYNSADITLPAGVTLAEGVTYVAVEAYYDTRPVTGFYFTEKDANGQLVKQLGGSFTYAAREDAFTATINDPDAGESKASSSCG
jgi:Flp pilus assembly protein TadG